MCRCWLHNCTLYKFMIYSRIAIDFWWIFFIKYAVPQTQFAITQFSKFVRGNADRGIFHNTVDDQFVVNKYVGQRPMATGKSNNEKIFFRERWQFNVWFSIVQCCQWIHHDFQCLIWQRLSGSDVRQSLPLQLIDLNWFKASKSCQKWWPRFSRFSALASPWSYVDLRLDATLPNQPFRLKIEKKWEIW